MYGHCIHKILGEGVPYIDCLREEGKLENIFLCPRNYKLKSVTPTGSFFAVCF